ncbi:MAG: site-2 protease family protein [Candidatus Gracilibacteria bacterium]|nr:site-2 protease family protein [Candidatus Gracilibacteria bacterium]
MSVFISIVAFLFIFSLLILIHEFGHFYAARKCGVKVEEFGLGLPPRAKGLWKDKKGTLFSLNWIPFGGFVRMYGEDSNDDSLRGKEGSFSSKSIPQRTIIILGGVIMNFLLGYVLLVYLMTSGAGPFVLSQEDLMEYKDSGVLVTEDLVLIKSFTDTSMADEEGMMVGDFLVMVDGNKVSTSKEVIETVQQKVSQTVLVEVLRGEEVVDLELSVSDKGTLGIEIGDYPEILEINPIPLQESVVLAARDTARLSWYTMKMFGNVLFTLVTSASVSDQVSGPVGIAQLTHQAAQKGFDDLIRLIVLLSISLGAINVLPIPALDGGRFISIFFEAVTGKRPNSEWEARIHAFGFLLLISLIFVITYKDIMRLIWG